MVQAPLDTAARDTLVWSSAARPGWEPGGGPATPEPTGTIVVVRHGETEWSRLHKHTGRTDIPLTDIGREQARGLVAALSGRAFDRVLVSPLARARETCELAGFGGQATTVDDLREWDYGAHEGLVTDEVRQTEPGWSVWESAVPGGESVADVAARADHVVALLRSQPGDTLVFAHGHILRVLAARWAGLPPQTGRRLLLGTAAIGLLAYEHGEGAIASWNLTALPR